MAVIALGATAVAVAAPAAAVERGPGVSLAATSTPEKSLDAALAKEAASQGISTKALAAQMKWENDFATLATGLETAYPNDFAGAEISASTPIIHFAAAAPEEARTLLLRFTPKVTIIENTGWSQASIAAAGESVHYQVQAQSASEVATSADVFTGKITVYVNSSDAAAASRAVSEVSSSVARGAGFDIALEVDPSLRTGEDALYGGGAMTGCTSGFSVKQLPAISNGIITADHCGNSQTFAGIALTYRAGSSTRDVQWHSTSSYAAPEIHWGLNGVYTVSGSANPVTGQTLCHEGMTSGFDCDTTYLANQCRGSYCGMMTMNNRECQPGDSGGPWFSGSTAYGVHSGYVTIWGLNRDMFTPINSGLSTLGITLKL
ncbi:S1 family peptidase [Microbacterium sp. NPDC058389]|uniref:S1 family peptidase n=1 Tax=Microbacterium sp. NPDC058389 TaxID=3346475 RepID=UPI00364C5A81